MSDTGTILALLAAFALGIAAPPQVRALGTSLRLRVEIALLPKPIPPIAEITAEQWRTMRAGAREAFHVYWARQGWVTFTCHGCGFPTAYSAGSCPACRPSEAPRA